MSRPKALKYCATCKYYGICKKRRHILREKKNSKKPDDTSTLKEC